MLLVVQICFSNTIQLVGFTIIKSWSVTCHITLESLQKSEFEVNNDINSKDFLCQGDITKLNVDLIVKSVYKTLIGGGSIGGTIHEPAGPGLLGECQKYNGCEIGKWRVTLGYKLPAKYVLHTVRLRDKNDYKLNDFYKSCSQKVLAENYCISLLHFAVEQLVFLGLIQRKLLKLHYPLSDSS